MREEWKHVEKARETPECVSRPSSMASRIA